MSQNIFCSESCDLQKTIEVIMLTINNIGRYIMLENLFSDA